MRFQVATRISFCRREISSCSCPPPPPPPPPPPLRRLREAAVERLHLDEEQVGLHFAAAILGHGVVGNHVAGLELAHLRRRGTAVGCGRRLALAACGSSSGMRARGLVDARELVEAALERSRVRSRIALERRSLARGRGTHLLRHLLEEQHLLADARVAVDVDRRRLPLAAVDRVAHLDAIEPEVVARLDAHRDFLDVARAPVAAGLHDLDDGLVVGDQRDQVVVGEIHGVAVEQRRDVVLAVLRDFERRAC